MALEATATARSPVKQIFVDFDGVIKDATTGQANGTLYSKAKALAKANLAFLVADLFHERFPSFVEKGIQKFCKEYKASRPNPKAVELLRELQRNGYEVVVLTSNNGVKAIKQQLEENGLCIDVLVKQPLEKLAAAKKEKTVILDDGLKIILYGLAYRGNLVSLQAKHNLVAGPFLLFLNRNKVRYDQSVGAICESIKKAIREAEA
ncbi:MAG: hypothetical protein QXT43_02535 [Candidatus Micrarchaeaceae archaeon]